MEFQYLLISIITHNAQSGLVAHLNLVLVHDNKMTHILINVYHVVGWDAQVGTVCFLFHFSLISLFFIPFILSPVHFISAIQDHLNLGQLC